MLKGQIFDTCERDTVNVSQLQRDVSITTLEYVYIYYNFQFFGDKARVNKMWSVSEITP